MQVRKTEIFNNYFYEIKIKMISMIMMVEYNPNFFDF